MNRTEITLHQSPFYAPSRVRSDIADALQERTYYRGDCNAFEMLCSRGRKHKASLNEGLFGDSAICRATINAPIDVETLALVFDYSVSSVEFLARQYNLEYRPDYLLANRLPNGQKYSRYFLRIVDGDGLLDTLVPYSMQGIRNELPNLPRESPTVSVFLQNLFSAIAAYKSEVHISTAFSDILTASEYTANWHSCYSWSREYSQSTSIRGMDRQTAIVWTTNPGKETKVGRFWVTFSQALTQYAIFPEYGDFSDDNVLRVCQHLNASIEANLSLSADAWESYRPTNRRRHDENPIYSEEFFETDAYIDAPVMAWAHGKHQFDFAVDWPKQVCLECGAEHRHDGLLCEDCTEGNASKCADCGDRIREGDEYWDERNDETLCRYCYRQRYRTCRECGHEVHRHDIVEHEGREYCQDCAAELFAECDRCDDLTDRDELTETPDGEQYCSRCAEKYLTACTDCGETFFRDALEYYGEAVALCDDCQEAWLEDASNFAGLIYDDLHGDRPMALLAYQIFPAATPARLHLLAGDRVIFKALDSLTYEERHEAPVIVTDMHEYFDGQTPYRIQRLDYYRADADGSARWFTIEGWTFSAKWIQQVLQA